MSVRYSLGVEMPEAARVGPANVHPSSNTCCREKEWYVIASFAWILVVLEKEARHSRAKPQAVAGNRPCQHHRPEDPPAGARGPPNHSPTTDRSSGPSRPTHTPPPAKYGSRCHSA
ncbi:Protein of unknown function [Gryllus bimaculatus]|nr:Protein of unknown function [Gryllus bimaculatus]